MKTQSMKITLYLILPLFLLSINAEIFGKRQPRITGRLVKVDLEVGTIKLRLDNDEGGEIKVISLAKKETPVEISTGQKAKLEELPKNLEITAMLSPVGDVESVKVLIRTRRTKLLGFDPEKGTVTVPGSKNGPDQTIAIEPKATIEIHDKTGELTQLRPGMNVSLRLSLDKKSVYQLSGYYSYRYGDEGGAIIDLDESENTIKLLTGRDGNYRIHTYQVAKDFRYYVDRRPRDITFQGLPVVKNISEFPTTGHVNLRVIPGTNEVLAIFGWTHFLVGNVVSVDPEKQTLQVKLEGGLEKTFPVGEKVRIRVGENPKSTLAALKPGMEIGIRLSVKGEEVVFIGGLDDD